MESVGSISGLVSGILFVIPILLVSFWWVILPAYYLMLVFELRSISLVESVGGKTMGLVGIVIVQILLPVVPLLLYPFMPGPARTGEPLGMDMKAYWAVYTGVAFTLCGFAVFYFAQWVLIRHKLREDLIK